MRKGALIGFGQVAEKAHAPVWQKSDWGRLVAVVEPDPQRQEAARTHLGSSINIFSDLSGLWESSISLDFVDVCTPPVFHKDQIAQSLEAGLHVLCEKPLVLHGKDWETVVQLTKEKNTCVFCVHNWKYAPLLSAVGDILNSGALGTPFYIRWETLRSSPAQGTGVYGSHWRRDKHVAGGGVLFDHGWHAFYNLLSWLREDPHLISTQLSRTNIDSGTALEDMVFCVLQFPKATAGVYLSWTAGIRANRGWVWGEKGHLEFENHSFQIVYNDGRVEKKDGFDSLVEGSAHPEWFERMLPEFFKEVEDPSDRGKNLEEVGWCIKLIQSAYRSSTQKGQWVSLGKTFERPPVFHAL